MNRLELYVPTIEELDYRQRIMSDPKTMSYNKGYDLQQFMIDERFQGRGYGSKALKLILDELKKEAHYDHVEVCVKRDEAAAIGLYEKYGFGDSGYIDEEAPDSVNMICYLTEGGAKCFLDVSLKGW